MSRKTIFFSFFLYIGRNDNDDLYNGMISVCICTTAVLQYSPNLTSYTSGSLASMPVKVRFPSQRSNSFYTVMIVMITL